MLNYNVAISNNQLKWFCCARDIKLCHPSHNVSSTDPSNFLIKHSIRCKYTMITIHPNGSNMARAPVLDICTSICLIFISKPTNLAGKIKWFHCLANWRNYLSSECFKPYRQTYQSCASSQA